MAFISFSRAVWYDDTSSCDLASCSMHACDFKKNGEGHSLPTEEWWQREVKERVEANAMWIEENVQLQLELQWSSVSSQESSVFVAFLAEVLRFSLLIDAQNLFWCLHFCAHSACLVFVSPESAAKYKLTPKLNFFTFTFMAGLAKFMAAFRLSRKTVGKVFLG